MNRRYRKTIIAGNWKMNKTASETKKFAEELKALLPKAKRRSEEFMGAALLFWLKKYSDEEFCRAIGSMSYTQGQPTEQSAPAAPSVQENDTKGE